MLLLFLPLFVKRVDNKFVASVCLCVSWNSVFVGSPGTFAVSPVEPSISIKDVLMGIPKRDLLGTTVAV